MIGDVTYAPWLDGIGGNCDQYGDDYIAGGPDDDMIFGQLGDDVIQGDGAIGIDPTFYPAMVNLAMLLKDRNRLVEAEPLMRRALEYARMFDLPVLDHCQDYSIVTEGVMHEGYWSTVLGLRGVAPAADPRGVAPADPRGVAPPSSSSARASAHSASGLG